MEMTAVEYILIAAAYLLGSVSSAILCCRLMGLPDPRTQGSGNPGATNVLRVGGKKAAAFTLVGDMLKGVVPVAVGQLLGMEVVVLGLVGLSAFLGHLFPVFFGFRGGKGVATALGVLIAAAWPVGLAAVATWLVMAKVFHISSLAALTAFALAPLYSWLAVGDPVFTGIIAGVSVLLFWRHRRNIRNLLSGPEGRLKERS
jgi:glycerol-3-phosphate acyltransferase PlsY